MLLVLRLSLRMPHLSLMHFKKKRKVGVLYEGGGIGPDVVCELNLSNIKHREIYIFISFMDSLLSTSGLFGNAVYTAVEKFQEASKHYAAFQNLLPRRSLPEAAVREQPQILSSHKGF